MGAGRLEEAHFQKHNSLSKISQITTSPKPQISVDLSNDDACEEHSAHHSHEITQNVDQFINSIAAIDDKSSSSPDITDFIENFSKIIESRVKKYNSSDTGTRFVKMTEEDLLFIHSVRRISKLTHALSEFPQDSSVNPSMNQTSAALQRAMVFLEEEFRALLEDFMFKLGVFSPEILIEKVTDGEYDQGEWFPVLVRACSSIVIKDRKMLPDVELADTVGCDAYELGRMINRLIDYFDLKLPEFDIVTAFERTFKSSPSFLVQCLIKWFVTTGRRPMPVVAARSNDSKARSGSCEHLQSSPDDEALQGRHPLRTGNIRRELGDEDNVHRKDYYDRDEAGRQNMVVKGREDCFPRRGGDGNSSLHRHGKADSAGWGKGCDISGGTWNWKMSCLHGNQ